MAHQPDDVRDLVISYCFPPFADTAAVVAAKRVRQRGRSVDVIANDMGSLRERDPLLAGLAGPYVVRHELVPTPTRFSSWPSIRDFTAMGLQTALKWDRERSYERLYSRAQFTASHILAARFAVERPDIYWTAEFSDPLSHDVAGAVRTAPLIRDPLVGDLATALERQGIQAPTSDNVYEWGEVLPFALADEILFTNEHQRDFMIGALADQRLIDRVQARAVISPHPSPPAGMYSMTKPEYALDPGCRHIAYFGNFYATRGMDTVLDALAALPPHVRNQLRLHIFTNKAETLEKQSRRRGLQDHVVLGPFFGYLDFLAMTTRFDCLLVNDAVTPPSLGVNPFLPSKWSDYRGSGAPVWGLVEEGSALSAQPLDYRSPVQHVTGAVQVLAQIALAQSRRGSPLVA